MTRTLRLSSSLCRATTPARPHSVAPTGPSALRKLKTSLALPAIAVLLAACPGEESSPIMLGAAGPWTEGYGAMNKRGIELALEHLNARPAYKDRPVSVVFRDDQADGARAAAIAQEFVENQNVLAVIGHVNSGAMVAAAKIYDGQLPAVSTTATSPDLSGMSPWTFRVSAWSRQRTSRSTTTSSR